ncbi:Ribonuclease H domain [Dillenia turbinata]|uniref:Ribonuclease H domain n=1 Tax=Dillenia turbinata TaxID=194707 RepID=A0AAN8VDH2_9MAGN
MLASAVNEGVGECHPWKNMITECRELLKELGVTRIYHIYREANQCADKLARLGKEAEAGFCEDCIPLATVRQTLLVDMSSVGWSRKKRAVPLLYSGTWKCITPLSNVVVPKALSMGFEAFHRQAKYEALERRETERETG